MVVTLGGVDLGKIETVSVSVSETINVSQFSGDAAISSAAVLVSTEGAIRNFTIKGKLAASSIAALKTAFENLQALVSGNQTAVSALVIDVEGTNFWTLNVFVQSFSYLYDTDSRATIIYTLEVVEGVASE